MKTILFILVSFIAVTATISGLLMISDPDGSLLNLDPGLLGGTPFRDYLLPGILLLGLVGGVNLVAVGYNMKRHPQRYNWAMAGGAVICGWIFVQVFFIQVAHWLHFFYLGIGLFIMLLAWQLKGKWVV